jgi:hypothetical protein
MTEVPVNRIKLFFQPKQEVKVYRIRIRCRHVVEELMETFATDVCAKRAAKSYMRRLMAKNGPTPNVNDDLDSCIEFLLRYYPTPVRLEVVTGPSDNYGKMLEGGQVVWQSELF